MDTRFTAFSSVERDHKLSVTWREREGERDRERERETDGDRERQRQTEYRQTD